MNSDLIIRGISGLIFLIVLIGAMLWSKIIFAFLFLLFTLVGLREFIQLQKSRKHFVDEIFIYFFGISVYSFLSIVSFIETATGFLPAISPIVLIYPLYALFNLFFKKVNDPGIHAPVLSSVLLIATPFGLLNFLFFNTNDLLQPVLVFFILLWSNDTFAYLIGKFLGRNKLMSNVSPKKTWEGFIGGIIFALVAAFILKNYSSFLNENNWYWVAICVGVFGTLGDLYESRMKRWADVKDSGNLMPGHGGVLDRFDGVMLSMPIILFMYSIF